MHFIVNTDLRRSSGYDTLIDELERQGIAYTLVRKPPTADFLVAMEDQYDCNGDNIPITLDIPNPVFVTGTTSMGAVSDAHGWSPGYITAPSLAEVIEHWGDHALNAQARFGTIKDIEPPKGVFFCRPDLDSKAFAGEVLDDESFEEFRARVLAINTWTTVPPETMVVIAPFRKIYAEYRTAIVEGRVVTACEYKRGSRVAYHADVVSGVTDFAQARVDEWNPRPAFVMDIAETDDGYKIIETNSISSSGFYALNMGKFINALAQLR